MWPLAGLCARARAVEHNMGAGWTAVAIGTVTFGCGVLGLVINWWRPKQEGSDETRDLINRITGLIATMAALVLGLLIASSNNVYNTQKSGLEALSARAIQLDRILQNYGPETKPIRDQLRENLRRAYESMWGNTRANVTSLGALAVGSGAVASALFLIIELSAPYSGVLRMPATPLLQAIDALGDQAG